MQGVGLNSVEVRSGNLLSWKMKLKLQFPQWPLEAGSKRQWMPTDLEFKMLNLTAEINMFTAWHEKQFWSL